MNLPDLKALEKIIQLCRKRGVKSIKIDNVELTLSEDVPAPRTYVRKAIDKQVAAQNDAPFVSEEPSELDLLFYSAGGVPPELKEDN